MFPHLLCSSIFTEHGSCSSSCSLNHWWFLGYITLSTSAATGYRKGTDQKTGIGLALAKHLLQQSWNVFLADLNPPPTSELSIYPSSSYHFHRTDVSSWGSQSSAFATCWSTFGRLDFCALNAGIDDRDDIFYSVTGDANSPPEKPNMKTFEVNLFGPYYGVKLAAHYMALNSPLSGSGKGRGGRIVITASDAGLWALHPVPQYTATKHGVVGLAKALAPSAAEVGVSVNAVAPSMTPSNLAPPGLLDNYPKEALTSMDTIMRAFDALGKFDQVEEEGWGGSAPHGQIVVGKGRDIYFKGEVEKIGGKEVSQGEFCRKLKSLLILTESRNQSALGADVQGEKQKVCLAKPLTTSSGVNAETGKLDSDGIEALRIFEILTG